MVFDTRYGYNSYPPVGPTKVEIDEMKKWCRENVGDNRWNYYGAYRKVPCMFRFKEEEDLLAFKLRFLF